ncbi:DUF397 domain-containing protein [Sphaerisporangium rubeum]|uniref:DUF397 domain-containing protein n=1 Tax=Sphaerisporangium rubeum TaxID=321317 RepID=UPI00161383A6
MDRVEVTWRKSSRSSAQGGNCVETAWLGTCIAIRDSKLPDGKKIIVDRDTWHVFADGLRRGLI